MRRVFALVSGAVLMVVSCGDGHGSTGGAGGGSDAGSDGGIDCEELRVACSGLAESECDERDECVRIEGALFDGNLEECLERPYEFISCAAAQCTAGYATHGCIFHPSEPDRLYCQRQMDLLPGWECVVECLIPEGLCNELR